MATALIGTGGQLSKSPNCDPKYVGFRRLGGAEAVLDEDESTERGLDFELS